MIRSLPVSRYFPAHHALAGQPTHFVEKILSALYKNATYYLCKCEACGWIGTSNCCTGGYGIADTGDYEDPKCPKCQSNKLDGKIPEKDNIVTYYHDASARDRIWPKLHTIREGKKYKTGDVLNLFAWMERPYRSQWLNIAHHIPIQRVVDFEIDNTGVYSIGGRKIWDEASAVLASNDGLREDELFQWFVPDIDNIKPFSGQVLILSDENLPY